MAIHGRCAILYFVMLATCGIVSTSAQAQTILYVNRTDSTCSGQSPCFTTIQAAINAAHPGSTVRIQAGTYREQITMQKNDFPGAVESDRVIIEADPNLQPGQVVLIGTPTGSCTNNYAIRIRKTNFLTIRGLTSL